MGKLLHCTGAALRLDRLGFQPDEPLALVTADDALAEIESLRKRYRLPAKVAEPDDLDDGDGMALIRALGSGSAEPAPLSNDQREWLAHRVALLRRALRRSRDAVDANGSPTACLLPADRTARVQYLVGAASVPLAWVRALNVRAF